MCGGGIGRRLTIKGDEIMDKLDQTKEKSSACQECETYKFAIMKASKALFYETLRCISVLAFVAVLAVTFHSYTPCWFLLLLILVL